MSTDNISLFPAHAAQAEGSDSEKKSGSLGHVFISYNWDHQETIVALGERLKVRLLTHWSLGNLNEILDM